jgi:hypothetical protein
MRAFSPKEISSREDLGIYLVTKPSYIIITLLIVLGNGIINTDGDLWKIQRKAGLQFLSNPNLKVLTDVALPKYLNDSIQTLQKYTKGSVIDLEDTFHELTTILFGFLAFNVGNLHPLELL